MAIPKIHKTLAWLLGIAVLFFVLSLAGAWYFSSLVMHPPDRPCNPDHFIYCNSPAEQNLSYEKVNFYSRDGVELKGWFLPAPERDKNRRRAVITVHGHSADRRAGARWFAPLHQAGFAVLTFDLRNYGKSAGNFTSMGIYEKLDVQAAVDFLQQKKKLQHIGVYGVSMGAVTSILTMAEDGRIEAGVFEAGYADLEDLFAQILSHHYGLPTFPLLPLSLALLEQRAGIDVDNLRPELIIKNISSRPVFIIHCPKDDYIEFSHGRRLWRHAQEPKQFWAAPCHKHARAWQSDPELAQRKVVSFFDMNLGANGQ